MEPIRIKRRIIVVALIVCLLLTGFVQPSYGTENKEKTTNSSADTAETDFSDYTPISTKEELDAVRNNLSGKYYLTCDIEFTEEDFAEGGDFYNDGQGWEPIGKDSDTVFSGTFDGNGHVICGLKMNCKESQTYYGLFSNNKGTIENIGVTDGNIAVNKNYGSGAIVGCNEGIVRNCYNTSEIVGTAVYSSNGYNNTIGGIVGCNKKSGTISGCYNEGNLIGEGIYTFGGIVGRNEESGTISECYNKGNLTADSAQRCQARRVGGIVGYNAGGTISGCHNEGNVTATGGCTGVSANEVGGIVGDDYYGGVINKCYNTGNIIMGGMHTDKCYGGGIAGETFGDIRDSYNAGYIIPSDEGYSYGGGIAGGAYGLISSCYNVGNIVKKVKTFSYIGGIAGEIAIIDRYGEIVVQGNIQNSYYLDAQKKGVGTGDDMAVRLTSPELQNADFLEGFDFDTVWKYGVNEKYPYPTLKNIAHIDNEDYVNFAGGNGTNYNPYMIADKVQLNNVRNRLECSYILINDIEFAEEDFEEGGAFYNGGEGWKSIGTEEQAFYGKINGMGHVICGLKMNCKDSETYYGLFSNNKGTIENIGVTDGLITVIGGKVGIIAGHNWGRIRNCYNTSEIVGVGDSSSKTYIGGIVENNEESGAINGCYNEGNLTGETGSVGGITVSNQGEISGCYNKGNLTGEGSSIGGITAINSGMIHSCYNKKDITVGSVEYIGGIVGLSRASSLISDCHNEGNITGECVGDIGGIVGCINRYSSGNSAGNSSISDCYNVGSITAVDCYSGEANQCGGIVGSDTHSTISKCYNTGNIMIRENDNYRGDYSGGIAGSTAGVISDCYNTGSVTVEADNKYSNEDRSGGIAGKSTGLVSNSYNVGSIIKTNNHWHRYGGITGEISEKEDIQNCYYLDTQEKGVGAGSDMAVQLTSLELQNTKFLEGFDFNEIWGYDYLSGYLYPQLKTNGLKEVAAVEVLNGADRPIEVIIGTNPDVSQIGVKITYKNGDTIFSGADIKMLTEFDCDKIGKQEVPLEYGEIRSKEFVTFNVIEKTLTSIEIIRRPEKFWYLEGTGVLDVTGGKLAVHYNNGTSEEVNLTEDMVTGFDNTKVGTQTLTVTYQGKTTTFDVEVGAKSIDRIEVTKLPTKLQYIEGLGTLDVTGGKLTVHYNNGTSDEIALSKDMVAGFDNTKVGTQTLTVTYQGKMATFDVEVVAKSIDRIEVTKLPTKLQYIEGIGTLDVAGGKVTAHYNNGTSDEIDLSKDMVSGFDNTKVGTQTLTVTYQGKTAAFSVDVIEHIEQKTNIAGIAFAWDEQDDIVYWLYSNEIADEDIKADVILDEPQKALPYQPDTGDIAQNSDGKRYEQTYSFRDVPDGEYKLAIWKPGYGVVISTVDTGAGTVVQEAADLYLMGDVNGDGKVNVTDINIIRLSILGRRELTKEQREIADVNHDEKINVTDINLIRLNILGRRQLT